jgi:hypothetical protein
MKKERTIPLELGITPLTKKIDEGLKVAFFAKVKRPKSRMKTEIHIGVVKSFNGHGVVVEGITLHGIYNRSPDKLFEVHKDISLGMFQ